MWGVFFLKVFMIVRKEFKEYVFKLGLISWGVVFLIVFMLVFIVCFGDIDYFVLGFVLILIVFGMILFVVLFIIFERRFRMFECFFVVFVSYIEIIFVKFLVGFFFGFFVVLVSFVLVLYFMVYLVWNVFMVVGYVFFGGLVFFGLVFYILFVVENLISVMIWLNFFRFFMMFMSGVIVFFFFFFMLVFDSRLFDIDDLFCGGVLFFDVEVYRSCLFCLFCIDFDIFNIVVYIFFDRVV